MSRTLRMSSEELFGGNCVKGDAVIAQSCRHIVGVCQKQGYNMADKPAQAAAWPPFM